jgi:hypothetical protein
MMNYLHSNIKNKLKLLKDRIAHAFCYKIQIFCPIVFLIQQHNNFYFI